MDAVDGKNLSKLKICCVKCQGEISDKVVTTPGGRTFHLEHFTCLKCTRVKKNPSNVCK